MYWSYYPAELDEDEIRLLFNIVEWLVSDPVVEVQSVFPLSPPEPAPIPCLGRVFLPARGQAPFLLSKT